MNKKIFVFSLIFIFLLTFISFSYATDVVMNLNSTNSTSNQSTGTSNTNTDTNTSNTDEVDNTIYSPEPTASLDEDVEEPITTSTDNYEDSGELSVTNMINIILIVVGVVLILLGIAIIIRLKQN